MQNCQLSFIFNWFKQLEKWFSGFNGKNGTGQLVEIRNDGRRTVRNVDMDNRPNLLLMFVYAFFTTLFFFLAWKVAQLG
ncbi:MAG: hypothetical protein KDI06_23135 [Calditrichaeota bacterium]|nr:hypothetical protein [Calditrichota bacterium]HQU74015.1 hypothetical protein [Calditrichia bacterium]